MSYINTRLNWEEVFFQEALDLEEKMISLDLRTLTKSRLRLSFEKKILDWKKYQDWIVEVTNVKVLSESLSADQLSLIAEKAAETLSIYSHHSIWNEDLIPFSVWDDHLIVLGLAYNENLAALGNCIFILTSPKTLTFLNQKLFPQKMEELQDEESHEGTNASESEDYEDQKENSLLSGIDFNQKKSEINFKNSDLFNHVAKQNISSSTQIKTESDSLWDYLSERHDEYCFEAKKNFDAYVVLKIVNLKTFIYKMDAEIEKHISTSKIFEQSVVDENPFSKVFKSGLSESFNMNQLAGETLLDYKYICITALKRGPTVIGFLLGLKSKRMAVEDEILLQELAKESA